MTEASAEDCTDQQAVIDLLSAPATFGVAGPVQRIDTHAAIIFLAGDHAYKLKRAVRYPYLDFSTLAKRKAVCEAELALNRRTAPELYLDLLPVGRAPDGRLALGAGEPVDWVVMMRRFPAEDRLDAVARAGRLEPALVRELADRIAAFHDGAAIIRGDGATRVRKVIAGNAAAMADQGDRILPADDCQRLHRRSLAAWETLAPLLDRRGAGGCVRHCHGDLHMANICLWQGRPTLFDCLEFDPELATTDTLYDLAFILMDMGHHGLRAAGSLLFNRYCDMRGESEGLAAMPLFLSMRAAVRAHVEASAADRLTDAAATREKREAARAYLAAALAFLERPARRLIAVGGLSGTGKSTLAAALAPLVCATPGARLLRTDVLRKRMAGQVPEERLPAEAYARARSEAVYARLIEEARAVLAAGLPVIIDGVFADPAERAAAADLAASLGVDFHGLWLDAPPQLLRERVEARRKDASDADAAVVDLQLGLAVGDLGRWTRLDAARSRDAILRDALTRIGLPSAHG